MVDDTDNWDYFLSHIPKQDELREAEKQELLINWGYLRKVLGEDWFKKEENKYHPLRHRFYNYAPWQLRWIGELGLGIETLSKKKNFDSILKRLLSANKFEGAYYEFQIGYSLSKLDVFFEFIKASKIKTPDILIDTGSRKMHLEVTKKDNPEDPLNSSQNFQKISWFLFSKGSQITDKFLFYCDILKPLSTPHTEQILGTCEELLEKAKKSGFEEYHIPNTIDIYFVKKEDINRVPKEKRIMQGRTPDFDELSRIRSTIAKKEVQLRSECPNVLLIFDSLLWPLEDKESFYLNIVNILEETVYQFANLSAVVIYIESYYIDDEPFTEEKGNYIVIQERDEKLSRFKNKVIIRNQFAKTPLSHEEIELLKKM